MIIITGGAGFIGSAFIWKLNQEGIKDILIVDALSHSEKWKNLIGLHYSDYIHKDDFFELIANRQGLQDAKAVIHMGACSNTTEQDMDYLMHNNYRYTQVLAEWCLSHDIYFMYASSAATYGMGENGFSDDEMAIPSLKPLNRYGYSKHFFDLYVLRQKLQDRIVGLKFFNVFGPNEYHKGMMQSMICKGVDQIRREKQLLLFKSYHPQYAHGEQKRDFIYVKECVNQMFWLYQNPHVKGIFNIGTGQAVSWNQLANALFSALNLTPNIQYIEMPDTIKANYQYFTQANMDKLTAAGYPMNPLPLEEAITQYVQSYLVKSLYLSNL